MHACLSPKVEANNTIYREPYAPKKYITRAIFFCILLIYSNQVDYYFITYLALVLAT